MIKIDLFKDRLLEILLFPIIMAMAIILVMSPFIIIDYFFKGWGIGSLIIIGIACWLLKFIHWIIIEPFFKNEKTIK